jgi:hypothetical protein
LFTSYELGVIRMLPFAGNRLFDVLIGVFLATAFLDVAMLDRAGLAFAIIGVLMLLNAFCTARPKDVSAS